MKIFHFAAIIQLLTTFYFGFTGLKFFNYFLKVNQSSEEKNEEIRILKENYKSSEINFLKALINEYKIRFEVIAHPRLYEIFIKAGIFSLFILIVLGVETKIGIKSYVNIFYISIFFIMNIIFRLIPIFTRINKRSRERYKQKGQAELLHNFKYREPNKLKKKNLFTQLWRRLLSLIIWLFFINCIYTDKKKEILTRGIFFFVCILLFFHLPLLVNNFFDIPNFWIFPISEKLIVIFVLITLFIPYVLFFYFDLLYTTFKRNLIAKIKDLLSSENKMALENESNSLIKVSLEL